MCTQQCLRRHVPQVQHTHKDSVEGQGGREAERRQLLSAQLPPLLPLPLPLPPVPQALLLLPLPLLRTLVVVVEGGTHEVTPVDAL